MDQFNLPFPSLLIM